MKKTTAKKREVKVIKYVKNEIKRGRHPSYKELQEKFNINYFNMNLNKIYSKLGIKFLDIPKRRPTGCNEILKKELIDFIKNEIQKGRYPSRREIEKKFRVHISILFGNIENLYISAGSRYIQKNSQEIKRRKANLFMKFVVSILPRFHLKIIKYRNANQRGIDILAKNTKGELIGIELKAYNKYERVKKRDIIQLRNFLIKEKLNKVILISTTSRIQTNLKIPHNIKIILFDDFIKFCNKDMIPLIKFIRTYSVHRETHEKELKRDKIIKYLKEQTQKGKKVTVTNISNDLNLDFYTYFESIYDAYKQAGILMPSLNIRGIRNELKRNKAKEQIINQILNFIKMEVKKGHYPSGEDIKNKFGIGHIWNVIRMSDLYNRLGLPSYLEREKRKNALLHGS